MLFYLIKSVSEYHHSLVIHGPFNINPISSTFIMCSSSLRCEPFQNERKNMMGLFNRQNGRLAPFQVRCRCPRICKHVDTSKLLTHVFLKINDSVCVSVMWGQISNDLWKILKGEEVSRDQNKVSRKPEVAADRLKNRSASRLDIELGTDHTQYNDLTMRNSFTYPTSSHEFCSRYKSISNVHIKMSAFLPTFFYILLKRWETRCPPLDPCTCVLSSHIKDKALTIYGLLAKLTCHRKASGRKSLLYYRCCCYNRCSGCNCNSSCYCCRSQRPRGLRHKSSSPARTLGSWVRIPFKAWMCLCCPV
jgi:hypothetical protein